MYQRRTSRVASWLEIEDAGRFLIRPLTSRIDAEHRDRAGLAPAAVTQNAGGEQTFQLSLSSVRMQAAARWLLNELLEAVDGAYSDGSPWVLDEDLVESILDAGHFVAIHRHAAQLMTQREAVTEKN